MGAGQSGGEALVGVGADVSGPTFLYEAIVTGRDAVTGRNLIPFEQGFRGTLGADAAYLIGRGVLLRPRPPAPTAPKPPSASGAPSARTPVGHQRHDYLPLMLVQ